MGRIIDLSVPAARVVDPAVLDANVVVARLVSSYSGQRLSGPSRAHQFFRTLVANHAVGILTPTAFNEVIHVAIRAKHAQEVATHRPALTAPYGVRRRSSWLDLYKIDPSILQAYTPVLDQVRLKLASHNVVVVGPDRLGPIPSGLAYDEEVVRLVGRYGLDTSDAQSSWRRSGSALPPWLPSIPTCGERRQTSISTPGSSRPPTAAQDLRCSEIGRE